MNLPRIFTSPVARLRIRSIISTHYSLLPKPLKKEPPMDIRPCSWTSRRTQPTPHSLDPDMEERCAICGSTTHLMLDCPDLACVFCGAATHTSGQCAEECSSCCSTYAARHTHRFCRRSNGHDDPCKPLPCEAHPASPGQRPQPHVVCALLLANLLSACLVCLLSPLQHWTYRNCSA